MSTNIKQTSTHRSIATLKLPGPHERIAGGSGSVNGVGGKV